MVGGFSTLNELSVIALIDGQDCSAEESVLGYYGLILWFIIVIYLMVGQFVICEEYLVPVLARLGDRMKIPEDVQGATLLAVGSSSPELFTALLGIIFYPHANPGPGTNVGSAVFNMCVIIGLSAIFAPKTADIQTIPFLRDTIFYMIGLIQLYFFYNVITPGYMDVWESVLLVAWWIIYVIIVFRTDLLTTYCCCCISKHETDRTNKAIQLNTINKKKKIKGDEYVALENTDKLSISTDASFLEQKSKIKVENGKMGVLYDDTGHCVTDLDEIQAPDNIHITHSTHNDDIPQLLDELNRKQRQNVNKGWMVVIDHNKQSFHSSHAYVRRRTLKETLEHQIAVTTIMKEEEKGMKVLHGVLMPWTKLFSCIIPNPDGTFASKHIYLTVIWVVIWLGILTFFVVDCAEKIGRCLMIPGSLLGMTLLAIGSSLPDCISSVIVAKQMKVDMAVANAFGSNIFDVNLCVGFSFMLGSIINSFEGESTSIYLGDAKLLATFSQLILVAAGLMLALWLTMLLTKLRLKRFVGYLFTTAYIGYVSIFIVLFIIDT